MSSSSAVGLFRTPVSAISISSRSVEKSSAGRSHHSDGVLRGPSGADRASKSVSTMSVVSSMLSMSSMSVSCECGRLIGPKWLVSRNRGSLFTTLRPDV